MKKGFTMIELIITIGLITILGLVIVMNMGSNLSKNQEKQYEEFKHTLENAACVYIDLNVAKNLKNTCKTNKTCQVSVSNLLSNGLIEEQDYICFSENILKERHKLEELKEQTKEEINEFEKKYDGECINNKLKDVIKEIVDRKELKKEDLHQLVNTIEIDKDRNVLIHFNFYELNCIGGYFNYNDDRYKEAVSS